MGYRCLSDACLKKTLDVFVKLMDHFEEDLIKVRLIAEVEYLRLNDDDLDLGESVNYHFASYAQEIVDDPIEFYRRHISKIISRMDNFHEYGSRLLLNKIRHIHIAISKLGPATY